MKKKEEQKPFRNKLIWIETINSEYNRKKYTVFEIKSVLFHFFNWIFLQFPFRLLCILCIYFVFPFFGFGFF